MSIAKSRLAVFPTVTLYPEIGVCSSHNYPTFIISVRG